MLDDLFRRTVYELDISLQCARALRDEGIASIADLVYLTESDIRNRPRLTPAVISEVKQALAARGLSLGARADPRTGRSIPNPILLHLIDELDLPLAGLEALKANGIYYIGDLTQRTEPELLGKPGIPSNLL